MAAQVIVTAEEEPDPSSSDTDSGSDETPRQLVDPPIMRLHELATLVGQEPLSEVRGVRTVQRGRRIGPG